MPYEYIWIPAPTNMSLPASPDLQDGFVENYVWSFVKQIKVANNSKHEAIYFCHAKECNVKEEYESLFKDSLCL